MAERLGNLGYFGLKKETTPGTAVVPDDFIPLYSESIQTNLNLMEDNPVAGIRFGRYQTLQGQRDHSGDFEVFGEANTTAKLFDMLMNKTGTTGSGPYTHAFAMTGLSNSYTLDISTGNHVFRMIGCQASEIAPSLQDNQWRWKVKVSCLKTFYGRELSATPTGSGPYTVTLSTTYDPSPTTGLVVGDLIRFVKASDGSTIDATVASIVNGTQITTSTNVTSLAAGDFVHLRPATVTFNLRAAFLFANTQFCFGATAAAALSASHTPVESDSELSLMHNFEDDGGAKRSGSFDPASLVRKQYDATLKIKRFFDDPNQVKTFLALAKTALVVRMYAEGSTYECRITFNNLRLKDGGKPMVETDSILYHELEYLVNHDTSDGQAVDVKVIDALTTV